MNLHETCAVLVLGDGNLGLVYEYNGFIDRLKDQKKPIRLVNIVKKWSSSSMSMGSENSIAHVQKE